MITKEASAVAALLELKALKAALRQAFPHFQEDQPITPEAISKLGQEYMALLRDTGPKRIEFIDNDGKTRAIVYETGDMSVGIPDGWVLE